MSRALRTISFGLAVGIWASGCSAPPSGGGDDLVVYDFVRDFEVAETAWERSRLRVADPEFERRSGEGWGPLKTDSEGVPYRWTLGERADFDVFVSRPRDVTFVCRCGTFGWSSVPVEGMSVEVGSFRSQPIEVGPTALEILIPQAAWQPGWNRFQLVASRAPSADLQGDEERARSPALRVMALEFRGLVDSSPPTIEGSGLALPIGSAIVSYGESAGQSWEVGDTESSGLAELGVYLHSQGSRVPLRPGSVDIALGEPIAVELVAEPRDPSMWRRLLGRESQDGAVSVHGARVLLALDRIPQRPVHAVDDVEPTLGAASGVIVYMIDTLRADRLGSYGSDRGLTPHLDALAEQSVVFTEARAQSSWTRPSVVSTFTGWYPQRHGVDDREDGLSGSVDTLAELLFGAGIYTGGIVTNGNISHQFGLGQGFAEYRHLEESSSRESYHVPAGELNASGLEWLDRHQEERPGQPFFLYLHATDPHAPYTPPEEFRSRLAASADPSLGRLETFERLREGELADAGIRDQLLALYDAEVAWTDHQVGAFVEALRQRDLLRRTMLIVVSDHGEEFLDHGGWEHGRTLFDEQLLVPLIVKLPETVARVDRIAGPAGHVDLMPTILDAMGVSFDPADYDGLSLWPALIGAIDRSTGASALSHLELSERSLRSLVHDRWKLVEDLASEDRRLFDLSEDAPEHLDLATEKPLRSGVLGQERRRLEQSLTPERATEVELDVETRKQLEALGYAG
ncbi:MAG: sulfatase [Thermoanaerobaculia bacterium]|nr:sulfatase [Thermoanaerobaculia bacterium]